MTSILYARRGEIESARHLLHEAKDADPTGISAFHKFVVGRARAHLAVAERRWQDAWSHYGGVVDGLNRSGLSHSRAKALREWAEGHLACAGPEDEVRARELLLESQAEFEAMGATGYVEQVEIRLKALQEPAG